MSVILVECRIQAVIAVYVPLYAADGRTGRTLPHLQRVYASRPNSVRIGIIGSLVFGSSICVRCCLPPHSSESGVHGRLLREWFLTDWWADPSLVYWTRKAGRAGLWGLTLLIIYTNKATPRLKKGALLWGAAVLSWRWQMVPADRA